MKRINVKSVAIAVLSCLAVVAYPCLFIYFNNVGEANLIDILPIWGILSGGALMLLIILGLIFNDSVRAAAVAIVVELFFMNFSILEKAICGIFPQLYYWHVAYILLVLSVIWSVIVKKKIGHQTALLIDGVATLACVVLILLNGVMSLPTIAEKMKRTETPTTSISEIESSEEPPNVYLCIFDEYGGYDCLKEYCNYDNSPFYDQLKELGFNVSYHSYGKTISTYAEVPNLLNLSYVNSTDMLISEQEKNLLNPVIYQLFRQAGYKINVAGGGFLDTANCEFVYNDDAKSKEFSAEYYIMMNSAYYPFYKHTDTDEAIALQNHLNYVSTSYKLSTENLFTISYVSCPHLPWFVDENGQRIDASLRENWLERSSYLGQLKYLNKLIIPMVSTIIENDPDSIIMLFSDHGFRCVTEAETMYGVYNQDEDKAYEKNILNAVYYKGNEFDIEGKTNINTARMIINKLFQTSYESLE